MTPQQADRVRTAQRALEVAAIRWVGAQSDRAALEELKDAARVLMAVAADAAMGDPK